MKQSITLPANRVDRLKSMTAALSKSYFRLAFSVVVAAMIVGLTAAATWAHPLGNFTINHFARLEAGESRVRIRYVVDMAEIPAFQAAQTMAKSADGSVSSETLNAYLERIAPQYAAGLVVTSDGWRLPLQIVGKSVSMPSGSGGLATLRVVCDFEGIIPGGPSQIRRLHFEDTNNLDRLGWHEIVVESEPNSRIFDSNVFGSQITDELKTYPQDMLAAPLDERVADFSWTSGAVPSGALALRTRDGAPAENSRDRFAELINVPVLTPLVALLGLLLAAGLGAIHALSPGHGKAVVGAYLVGSKGTARHAAFLGLTVTVTHTAGVFALGMVTLFASQYIVPERIFPILSFASGAIVLVMGLSLFIRRLRPALAATGTRHSHSGHTHGTDTDHSHDDLDDSSLTHSHGGQTHSHLPPGSDGSRVTWRSLLALGISGGLLPCPSALVVLLSAIALHRVGYGLLLVVAFSVGLAATLTAIGLVFVFAGRFFKPALGGSRVLRVLPAMSALIIACVGAAICYEAIGQAGINLGALAAGFSDRWPATEGRLTSVGAFAVVGMGLVFGLKHATEVDHVIAVSTIVSEHRNILRSAVVGGFWGVGHTASLILVGVIVLAFRVAIPDSVSSWLEFAVSLMIIGLGLNALLRALRRRTDVHLHKHDHEGLLHAHTHFHEPGTEHPSRGGNLRTPAISRHSHEVSRIGLKPLLVGAMHGLAGSGALTVLVLTQVNSATVGLAYLAVFGVGSIIGMLVMSFVIGLPFAFSARRFGGLHYGLQTAAGALSIGFGFWYAWQIGMANQLLAGVFATVG